MRRVFVLAHPFNELSAGGAEARNEVNKIGKPRHGVVLRCEVKNVDVRQSVGQNARHGAYKAWRIEASGKGLLRHKLVDGEVTLRAEVHGAVATVGVVGAYKEPVRSYVRVVGVKLCPSVKPHLIVGATSLRVDHAKVGVVVTQRRGVEQRLKIFQRGA